MLRELVVVVGTDGHGIQVVSVHCVNVTEAQQKMNSHIDMAIFEAEEIGLKPPFTTFDNSQHDGILGAALVIKQMRRDGHIPNEA
jgi:hypothetical protein